MPSPFNPRRRRTLPRQRQPRGQQTRPATAAVAAAASAANSHHSDITAPPTASDRRRWFDYRSGISEPELAARENVPLAVITRSIATMKAYQQRHSAESAELATRELYLGKLGEAREVFSSALAATKKQTEVETYIDDETGEPRERMAVIDVPDHATRLKAMDALTKLLVSVQPKTPMVAVDARTQNNVGAGGMMLTAGGSALPGQPMQLSSEAIIRQLRLERGLPDPAVVTPELQSQEIPVERDFELEPEPDEEDDETAAANVVDGEIVDEEAPEE